jgi:hypothetical protein
VTPHPRHVILRSYLDTGALDRTCPQCQAGPAQWCRTPDGRDRRIPCVARMQTNNPKASR